MSSEESEITNKLSDSYRLYLHVSKILGADPHIIKIIPAEDLQIPRFQDIDISRFDKGLLNRIMVKKEIGSLYHNVFLPYIVDDFTNPTDRDDWRNRVSKDFYMALLENALRPEKFVAVRSTTSTLQRLGGVEKDDDWGQEFHHLADQVMSVYSFKEERDGYRELPADEQIRVARQLKQATADFLKHLVK